MFYLKSMFAKLQNHMSYNVFLIIYSISTVIFSGLLFEQPSYIAIENYMN